MAKNVKSAAAKSRETKLSKKSHDELIQIILRKDKTEKNLSTQVVSLKAENNELSIRVNNFDKDMQGTIDGYEKQIREIAKKMDEQTNDFNSVNKANSETVEALQKSINRWKVIAIAAICIGCLVAAVSIYM